MIQVCFTIDSEGDASNAKNSGCLGIRLALPQVLGLFSKYGIRATFFVQEDRLNRVGKAFNDLWIKLERTGHEIGLHTHGLVGQPVQEKIQTVQEGISRLRSYGLDVVSFRGGQYHMDHRLVEGLEKSGILYDSSVVPGLKEHNKDGSERCDHIGAPEVPYYLSYEDHRKRGDSRILELPINRYPYFSANEWSGLLTGRGRNEEILFDYFAEIQGDKLIVVDMHSWDGLSQLIQDISREKKHFLAKAALRSSQRILGPNFFINKSYFFQLERFLKYIARKANIRFLPIRETGEYIRSSLAR